MNIKLSNHDKNMVAMSWLVEVFLNGLSQENKSIPEHKQEQYDELRKNYQTALEIISDVNESFSHDLGSVFGAEYTDKLTDLTTILTILYQTVSTEKMLEYFKWIGTNNMLAKRAEKDKELKVNEGGLAEFDCGDDCFANNI